MRTLKRHAFLRTQVKPSRFLSAPLLATLLSCGVAYSEEAIPLVHAHGTLQVPVVVNGNSSFNFTIDSGATDVSIPANVFLSLISSGTVLPQDYLDKQPYKLADGSTEFSQRFRIRSLRVGNLELRDVIASVVPSAGSLLLGQSFLSRLKSWSIDNERQVLLITPSATSRSSLIVARAKFSNSGSGWVRITAVNDSTGELLVNTASFQGDGKLRRVFDKHIFPAHSERWLGKWVSYAEDQWEFNCGEKRAKLHARTDTYEDGSHWIADSNLISSTAWHRVDGDTLKEGEMKLLCEWQPSKAAASKTPH